MTQQRPTAHIDNGAVQKKMQVRRSAKFDKAHALAFYQLCKRREIELKDEIASIF